MVIVNRVNSRGEEFQAGIPVVNIIEVNPKMDEPGSTWVKYWAGQETRSLVSCDSLQVIQMKMFKARHGKMPAKGVLEA